VVEAIRHGHNPHTLTHTHTHSLAHTHTCMCLILVSNAQVVRAIRHGHTRPPQTQTHTHIHTGTHTHMHITYVPGTGSQCPDRQTPTAAARYATMATESNSRGTQQCQTSSTKEAQETCQAEKETYREPRETYREPKETYQEANENSQGVNVANKRAKQKLQLLGTCDIVKPLVWSRARLCAVRSSMRQ
jgi:hypothetical protein